MAYQKLMSRIRTVRVVLPDGKDPGSMVRDEIWDLIAHQCEQQGVSFKQLIGGM